MAELTLILDVQANVNYQAIEAEVNKIIDALNKIPQKKTINIDVSLSKGAIAKIDAIRSQINSAASGASISTTMRRAARDIDAVSKSASNMGGATSTALRDQIDALTGVSSSTKSARESADAMRMAWAMQAKEAKASAEAEKILANSQKQQAESSEKASYPLRDQIDALTGVSSSTKSARESADAMRMAWAMQSKEAKRSADAARLVERAQIDGSKALARGERALSNWTKMSQSSSDRISGAYKNLKDAVSGIKYAMDVFDGSEESAKNVADAVSKFNIEFQKTHAIGLETGTACKTLGERVSDLSTKFASWLTISQAVMLAFRSVKAVVNEAIAVNDAMTQLRIVTNESDDVYQRYGANVAKTAQNISASMTDIIDATTVFARLGYSLDESATLAELTAMLQKVGNIEAGDAQAALTSIIKAFNFDVADMEFVMDKLVSVGNNFPISVSEIATGMSNASSALAAAGNDFDKSVALLAAANTTVQNASKSSTGLRTITARLRKTDSELNDLGESMTESAYSDLVGALTKHNVALQKANGEYRDTYDIMSDIAGVWDQMSSAEQSALAELAAGNRQQAIFYSIIENFDVASGAINTMQKSSGEMRAAYSEYTDSTTAHIETFKAAFQGFSSDFVSSDLLSFIVDVGTGILNIADGIVRINDTFGTTALTIGSLVAVAKSVKSIS